MHGIGMFELLIIGFLCAVPLLIIVAVIVVVAFSRKRD